VNGLVWERDSSELLPFESAHLAGVLRLDPDGRLYVGDSVEAPFEVELDIVDRLTALGVIDLLTSRFDPMELTGAVRNLEPFLGASFDTSADASVRLRGAFESPEVDVTRLELDRFRTGDALSIGDLITSAQIDHVEDLSALGIRRGAVTLSDVVMLGYEAAEATARYELEGNWITIADGVVESEFGRLRVEGRARIRDGDEYTDDPQLDLEVDGRNLDLAGLLPDLDVTGTIETVEADVSGRISSPDITAELQVKEVLLFDELIDDARASVEFDDDGVRVDDLVAHASGAQISGSLALDEAFNLLSGSLRVFELDLTTIERINQLGLGIGGVARVVLDVREADSQEINPGLSDLYPADGVPDVEGSLIIDDLEFLGEARGALALTIDTYGDMLRAVGLVARDFETEVEFPLRGSPALHVAMTFDHLGLATLLPAIESVIDRGEANRGLLDTRFDLDTGTLVSKLWFNELWLEIGGRRFQTTGTSQVSYTSGLDTGIGEGDILRVPQLRFGTPLHSVSLEGALFDWERLDMSMGGEAELSLAPLFTELVAEASGLARIVDLHIGGSPSAPAFDGTIAFDQARLVIRGIGDELVLSSGEVDLFPNFWGTASGAPGQLRLSVPADNPIEGTLFDGGFTLYGNIGFDHFAPQWAELTVDATNMTYRLPDEATIGISRAELDLYANDLSAEAPEFFLSGNVFLEEALYFKIYAAWAAPSPARSSACSTAKSSCTRCPSGRTCRCSRTCSSIWSSRPPTASSCATTSRTRGSTSSSSSISNWAAPCPSRFSRARCGCSRVRFAIRIATS